MSNHQPDQRREIGVIAQVQKVQAHLMVLLLLGAGLLVPLAHLRRGDDVLESPRILGLVGHLLEMADESDRPGLRPDSEDSTVWLLVTGVLIIVAGLLWLIWVTIAHLGREGRSDLVVRGASVTLGLGAVVLTVALVGHPAYAGRDDLEAAPAWGLWVLLALAVVTSVLHQALKDLPDPPDQVGA